MNAPTARRGFSAQVETKGLLSGAVGKEAP